MAEATRTKARTRTLPAALLASALAAALCGPASALSGGAASGGQVVQLVVAPVAGVAVAPDGSVTSGAGNVDVQVTRDTVNGVETVTVVPAPDTIPR